jgi:hypothetical protein
MRRGDFFFAVPLPPFELRLRFSSACSCLVGLAAFGRFLSPPYRTASPAGGHPWHLVRPYRRFRLLRVCQLMHGRFRPTRRPSRHRRRPMQFVDHSEVELETACRATGFCISSRRGGSGKIREKNRKDHAREGGERVFRTAMDL